MIDYFKLWLFIDYKEILPNLETAGFKIKGSYDFITGEAPPLPLIATKGNLKIEIKTSEFIQITGSIHKYAHSGVNYTDFNYNELLETLLNLIQSLGINPYTTEIHNIEIGVNINPPFVTKQFLKKVLNYGGKSFIPMPSDDRNSLGIICQFTHFRLKMYCKKTQYHLPEETMRFEIHVEKMQYLEEKNITCKYLSDLFNIDTLISMGNLLNKVFDDIIILDDTVDLQKLNKTESTVYEIWSHPLKLQELCENNKDIFQYQRRQFRDIQKKYSTSNKQQIASKLIAEKINLLLITDEKTSTILTNFQNRFPPDIFNQSYQLLKAGKNRDFNLSYHSDKREDSLIVLNDTKVSPFLKTKQFQLQFPITTKRELNRIKKKLCLKKQGKIVKRRKKKMRQLQIPFPYEFHPM